MADLANEEVIRWLLSLYQSAREMPLGPFKDEVFRSLKAFIPLSSAVWVNTGFAPEGGLDCFGIHLFDEPEALSEELISTNRKVTEVIRRALSQPGKAHSFYSYGMYAGRAEHAQVRDYICRFGHQNLLVTVDTAAREGRSEWVSLFRSRHDDHFTPSEQQLMGLLVPHVTEALAIARQLSEVRPAETGSSLAGTRALIQTNGVMLTCGEQFKQLLRKRWPDWFSGRLPPEILDSLRLGATHFPAQDGTIALKAEKLGPYLFVEAREHRGGITSLTAREGQIAQLFAAGKHYRQIASATGLQPSTVRNVLQKVYRKLQVANKPALVRALQGSAHG
jgi:DNA-binding CsgD family transcriptional regulator